MTTNASTVNAEEVGNFEKIADEWWDPKGPLKPLHKLNPTRIAYLKKQICNHFGRDNDAFDALDGLTVLDVGCGGGLVCEPLSRLGGLVTGIDPGANAIDVAQKHAEEYGLDITYKCTTSEDHSGQYDVVLALEIIEHVADIPAFINSLLKLVKPDGIIIFSTLNRTAKSFALGIIAAEYVLRWVPRGTHDWKKFIKPSELARYLRDRGATVTDITGLVYNPLTDGFSLSKTDMDVNYFLCAKP